MNGKECRIDDLDRQQGHAHSTRTNSCQSASFLRLRAGIGAHTLEAWRSVMFSRHLSRRHLFGLAGTLIAWRSTSTPVDDEIAPINFAFREMYHPARFDDVPISYVATAVYGFEDGADSSLGLDHLREVRLGPIWAEIYMSDVVPIDQVSMKFGANAWFVSYIIIAGAAGIQTPHASCLFVEGDRLHEIVVAAKTREAAEAELSYLAHLALDRSENTESDILKDYLLALDDLPEGFEISRDIDPYGQYDEDGARTDEDVPPWDRLLYAP
jgi:hypothetical protein